MSRHNILVKAIVAVEQCRSNGGKHICSSIVEAFQAYCFACSASCNLLRALIDGKGHGKVRKLAVCLVMCYVVAGYV